MFDKQQKSIKRIFMRFNIFVLFILFFSFVFCYAEEKKIRVIVEGEEDTNTTTSKEITPTTQKDVYILKTQKQIDDDIRKLKEIAENPKMEGEIIDAIISKIIDLETYQQKQMKLIITLFVITLLMSIFIIIIMIKKK
ncbi:MAG: hypothetical protein N2114_05080 [Candidatus Goldbacteria bacterium]|nr:hypothetical protein [Candidatus Goldiibacteriota bacterium]